MCCKQFITHIILAALEGLWHLGSLFYHDTQYSQRGWYVTIFLLCDIPRNKAPRTGPRNIWCTYTVPFLWSREEHKRQISWVYFAGQCLLWLLLLRLAALVVVVLLLLLLLLPQNSFLTSLAFATDSESVSATKISRMASSTSFFFFFFTLLETHNRQPSMDCYVWLGTVSERNISKILTSSTVTVKQI